MESDGSEWGAQHPDKSPQKLPPLDRMRAQPTGDAASLRLHEKLVIFFDILVSISTFILAVFTISLWKSTDELRKFAEQQTLIMKDQLKQNNDAVIASQKQAQFAEQANRSLAIGQRPSFTLTQIENDIDHNRKTGQITYIPTVTIKNTGSTSAKNTVIDFAVGLYRANQVREITEFIPYSDEKYSAGNIGGGQESQTRLLPPLVLTREQVDSVVKEQDVILIWFKLSYNIPFDDKVHHSQMCRFFTQIPDTRKSNYYWTCPKFNDED